MQLFGQNFVDSQEIVVLFMGDTANKTAAGTYATDNIIECISPTFATSTTVAVSVALNGQQFTNSQSFFYYGLMHTLITMN